MHMQKNLEMALFLPFEWDPKACNNTIDAFVCGGLTAFVGHAKRS